MATRKTTATGGFTGFPKGGEGWFHQLAAEMSRDWFLEHKGEYEALWQEPMGALLEDVRARIAPTYKATGLATPKIFRINRDVRFAKDTSPYKTHIAGLLSTGKGGSVTEQAAALYVSFGMEELTAAGLWIFSPEQLARWRAALLDKKRGAELDRILAALRERDFSIDAHESLVRVPKGFDPEHPRAELARHKGLAVGFDGIPRGLIHKPALVDWLAERSRTAAPLVTWLCKNVA